MRPKSRWSMLAAVAAAAVGTVACGSKQSGAPPTQPTGGISDQARQYLDRALQIMETNSVKRLTVDWSAVGATMTSQAAGAQTPSDTYPAIGAAIRLIGDGHSLLVDPGGTVVARSSPPCPTSRPAAPVVPPTIGYVRVPAFSGTSTEATAYADGLQRDIASADRDDLTGWILDLRGNGGGNMWAMAAGIGPLIGDGVFGYFVASNGSLSTWDYRNGASRLGGNVQQQVSAPYQVRRAQPRVAVLVDGAVASSGEAMMIAFRGRGDARSFGTPTCGLSNANQTFPLSDGATLSLTVVLMADRARAAYGSQIAPDDIVTDPAQAVDRAIAWLRGEG